MVDQFATKISWSVAITTELRGTGGPPRGALVGPVHNQLMSGDWQTRLDATTKAFTTEFRELPADALNRRPDARRWSIAQNVEHLIVVSRSYYPQLEAIGRGLRPDVPLVGRLPFVPRLVGSMILGAVRPDNARRVKTFPVWEPGQSDVSPDVLERFAAEQATLEALITGVADAARNGVLISSPANRHIVYRLDTGLEIIVVHQQRHLAQARQVLQTLRSVGRA